MITRACNTLVSTSSISRVDGISSARNHNRFEVSIDVIRYKRYKVEDKDLISEIAESMKVTRGQTYAPVDVYKVDGLYYAAGGRSARLEAIRKLGWLTVRVRILEIPQSGIHPDEFHPLRLKGDKRVRRQGRKAR